MREIQSGETSFLGRTFSSREICLVQEIVGGYPGLSRTELAATVCELLEWKRPNGSLKTHECRGFLEVLEERGVVGLPAKRVGRPLGAATPVLETRKGGKRCAVTGSVEELSPVFVEAVETQDDRLLFRELVAHYHYLGHKVPFGAHLRYLVRCGAGVLGCLQFSSPAWRIRVRDQWIGWDDATRAQNLQMIVNNSRFLILPWVRVKNLASRVLSLACRRLAGDWERCYAVRPILVETLVDPARFSGGCYRASNWICLGVTSGRGREDRKHERHGAVPKAVWVYRLTPKAQTLLGKGESHG